MKFSCDQCHAQYMIADEKVGARGVKVKCKKCGNVIVVKPQSAADDAPAASAPSAAASAPASASAAGFPSAGAFGAAVGFGGPTTVTTIPGANPAAASAGFGSPVPGFGDDLAGLGSLAAQSTTAAAPSSRPAGEKEWYVAIDDSQVGPIDVAEIEQRWDAREIDEDTLAWKAGMGDWLPVAEIPDLAYLVTERPHQKSQGARATQGGAALGGAAQSSPGMAAAPAGGLGPVAFGGGAAPGGEEVGWQPSAASALSSLVQEELTAAATPKSEPAAPAFRPAGIPDMGMPAFGAGDLFGAGGNGGGAAAAAAARPAMDPFAAPAPAWSVPVTPRHTSSFKTSHLMIGVFGVAILGLLGFLAWQLTRTPRVVAQVPMVAPPMPGGVPGTPVAPVAAGTPTPSAPTAAVTPTPSPTPAATPAHTAPREDDGGRGKRKAADTKPDKPDRTAPREEPAPKPAANVKPSLGKDDVFAGVKKNSGSMIPCIKEARGKNEIVPGPYTFTLDWTIKPDGSVANARLKGPANVMGTSLPACFARVMRNWEFPPSQRETPIANFPFGPVKVP